MRDAEPDEVDGRVNALHRHGATRDHVLWDHEPIPARDAANEGTQVYIGLGTLLIIIILILIFA